MVESKNKRTMKEYYNQMKKHWFHMIQVCVEVTRGIFDPIRKAIASKLFAYSE